MSYIVLFSYLYLAVGVIYFASKRPQYSHLSHSISELAESGSKYEHHVSYLVFLPYGTFLILAGLFYLSDNQTISYLALAVGLSYFLSAFFPCDPNTPAIGSWKNFVHNLIGGGCYAAMLYLLNEFPESDSLANLAFVSLCAFVVIFVVGWPRHWLGMIQRVAEFFVLLTIVKWML